METINFQNGNKMLKYTTFTLYKRSVGYIAGNVLIGERFLANSGAEGSFQKTIQASKNGNPKCIFNSVVCSRIISKVFIITYYLQNESSNEIN